MVPQDRGLEGLSIYFIFCLMENNSYMSLLGGSPSVSLIPRFT
jgi:hypothetical protein